MHKPCTAVGGVFLMGLRVDGAATVHAHWDFHKRGNGWRVVGARVFPVGVGSSHKRSGKLE